MAFSRSVFIAAAALGACSSSSNNGGGGGSASGTHYHYVASRILAPVTAAESQQYGFDLNGDGVVDNKLGGLLSDLAQVASINAQASIDQAVLGGGITLLGDFQTSSFTSTSAAGLQFFLGSDPNPPACGPSESVTCTGSGTSETCTGCGDDLQGSATFDVMTNSNEPVVGPVSGGVFTAGSTTSTLQIAIALGSGTAIDLNLVDAHVKAPDISATAIGDGSTTSTAMIIGGAILQSDLNNNVIPGLVPLFLSEQTEHCGTYSAGNCNPGNDSTCSILEMFMDNSGGSNSQCMITAANVESSAIVESLLSPDLMLSQGSAISVGVGAYFVPAEFTVAGEGEGSD